MDAFFPKAMLLTLPGGNVARFEAGMNALPDELANHWWLKANGVTLRISSVRPT